jgi:hypothetical protein
MNIQFLAVFLYAASLAQAADFVVPDETLSPSGALGVRVPIYHEDSSDAPDPRRNAIVEVKTGKIVATLAGDPPAYDRELNHHGTGEARWSADSSLLLWKVDGKWNPDALELVKIGPDGRLAWQIDILDAAQQALLARTREAAAKTYAAAKKENAGSGSAFPDGFTIDVTTGPDVALPLAVHADLTANPKGIEDYPANLDSYLDAEVTADGRLVVKHFALGSRPMK